MPRVPTLLLFSDLTLVVTVTIQEKVLVYVWVWQASLLSQTLSILDFADQMVFVKTTWACGCRGKAALDDM